MQSRIFIDDAAGLNLKILREKATRLRSMGLIVIDHLSLMRSPWKRGEKRRIEIAEISAGLKAIAQELKIPIIVIAKLNRNSEKRSDGLPHLSDLGKSSVIGYYADVVGILYRLPYYPKDKEKNATSSGDAGLIVAKNRNGSTGTIPLNFLSAFTRFESRDDNLNH